jgi:hypothetical protein
MQMLARVVGWVVIITLIGTCAGMAFFSTRDANSSQGAGGALQVSCFVGTIVARDTATEQPKFIIQALEPPEVHHDSVVVPEAPHALVCSRFRVDGAAVKPSSSALRLRL